MKARLTLTLLVLISIATPAHATSAPEQVADTLCDLADCILYAECTKEELFDDVEVLFGSFVTNWLLNCGVPQSAVDEYLDELGQVISDIEACRSPLVMALNLKEAAAAILP